MSVRAAAGPPRPTATVDDASGAYPTRTSPSKAVSSHDVRAYIDGTPTLRAVAS